MHLLKATLLTAMLALAGRIETSSQIIRPMSFDTPSFLDVESTTLSVADGEGQVRIELYRTGEFRQPTRLEYQTRPIDATEGVDYRGTGGTLIFEGGEGFKTVTVEILPGRDRQASRQFEVEFTTSDPNAIIMRGVVTVTIEPRLRPLSDQPKLEIIPGPENTIVLAWDGSSDLVLERSSDPAAGVWEEFACEKSVRQSRCEVTQPLAGRLYFYRLRTP